MAHRIDGRKLGRKTAPRMALYAQPYRLRPAL